MVQGLDEHHLSVTCFSICLSIHLSIYLLLSSHLSFYLSIHVSVYLSSCLPVPVCVCLSLSACISLSTEKMCTEIFQPLHKYMSQICKYVSQHNLQIDVCLNITTLAQICPSTSVLSTFHCKTQKHKALRLFGNWISKSAPRIFNTFDFEIVKKKPSLFWPLISPEGSAHPVLLSLLFDLHHG